MTLITGKLTEETFDLGDMVVTDMHMHTAKSGICAGWRLYDSFEITRDMFFSMLDGAEQMGKKLERHSIGISSKGAYAINRTIDVDGYVSSVLVVYQHDSKYRCAVLYAPHWDMVFYCSGGQSPEQVERRDWEAERVESESRYCPICASSNGHSLGCATLNVDKSVIIDP